MSLACPVCGTAAVPDARFCFHCGAPLDRPAEADVGAERRVVTVLFGDLSDFTAWAEDLDPERVGVVTDAVLAELARAVTDVGGHVDKLTGDGIMAVFGAPTAHEDDPERAVRAAAGMQATVRARMAEEMGGGGRLGLRVGLNTGEVLAGVQAAMAYTVVGDTVNTASRLADAAQVGSVYAGRATALATMSIASWRALAPLRLKGKREPVPAYELIGLRPAGSARLGIGEQAAFVGREAELGRLIGRLMEVVERGEPAAALVVGDAGVGKSRLVAELGRFAAELPAGRVLSGRCPPFGAGRGLAPLAEWVRTACGVTEADTPAEAAARVRRTLARLERPASRRPLPVNLADRLLALLGYADGTPVPREAATPGALAELGELGDPLVDAVAVLLEGLAAGGPLLCVVDDLQWATPALAGALGALLERVSGPVLLVGVGRGDLLAAPGLPADWWRSLAGVEVLPVVPLDTPAADRLLRAYLGGAELEPAVRDLLIDRAQGNAFFLAELLHLLVDRGVLRPAGDGWRLHGPLPDRMLPAGVQSVLVARVDELEPTAKALLRDASVLGTRFDEQLLAAMNPLAPAERAAALATLVARGLLVRVEPDGGEGPVRYDFAHTLARDVVYAGIPKAERAHRHAAVARWAAGELPAASAWVDVLVGTQAEQAVALAREMRLPAEDPAWQAAGAGFDALLRLAQGALARDDNAGAELLFSRALGLAPADLGAAARDTALTGRAAARVALHRLAEAAEDLAEPLQATHPAARAAAMVVRGELLRRQGLEPEARRTLVSALALAGQEGVDRVTAEALRQLGMLEYLSGRLTAAEQRFREAADLAERVHDRRGVGWALQHLAWSATTRGDWALAEDTLRRASDVFGDLDDTGGLSWCAGTEAFVRLLQGRFTEARDLAQGLLPLGEAMGDRWGVAACQTIDAFAAAELGAVTEACEVAGSACAGFDDLHDTWGRAMALIACGAAQRAAGDAAAAVELLTEAVACSVAARHVVTEALASTVLGYCRLDAGDPAGALAAAEAALTRLGDLDLDERALMGPTVLRAQALRGLGRSDAARALLAAVADSPEGPSLIFPRRQALAHYAGVLLAGGERAQALEWAHRAMAVPAQDVRSRVVALRVLAACYAACGDPPAAGAALRQALGLAYATEQVSERRATEELAGALNLPGGTAAPRPAP